MWNLCFLCWTLRLSVPWKLDTVMMWPWIMFWPQPVVRAATCLCLKWHVTVTLQTTRTFAKSKLHLWNVKDLMLMAAHRTDATERVKLFLCTAVCFEGRRGEHAASPGESYQLHVTLMLREGIHSQLQNKEKCTLTSQRESVLWSWTKVKSLIFSIQILQLLDVNLNHIAGIRM